MSLREYGDGDKGWNYDRTAAILSQVEKDLQDADDDNLEVGLGDLEKIPMFTSEATRSFADDVAEMSAKYQTMKTGATDADQTTDDIMERMIKLQSQLDVPLTLSSPAAEAPSAASSFPLPQEVMDPQGVAKPIEGPSDNAALANPVSSKPTSPRAADLTADETLNF